MITIAEYMTTEVETLSPQHSLRDASALMEANRIRHVPVVDENGLLVGLVSQRDLLAASESALSSETHQEKQVREQSVKLVEVMRSRVRTVDEDCSLRAAALDMQKHEYGCLPIVRERKLVGIITDTDYVSIAINLLEQVEEVEEAEPLGDTLSEGDI